MSSSSPQILVCDYCGSTFKTEKGHASHSCKKKKLAESAGDISLRKAYILFDYWFKYNSFSKKSKTKDQFLKSPYFSVFIDLEKSLRGVHVVSTKSFIEWLSKERIPCRDWNKDSVMARYKSVMDKIEDPLDVTVRSLEKIASWCDKKSIDISSFFDEVRVNEALNMVKNGWLSPWVLFLSEKSGPLLDSMNQDQLDELDDHVDLSYWESRFKVVDTNQVKDLLAKVGL